MRTLLLVLCLAGAANAEDVAFRVGGKVYVVDRGALERFVTAEGRQLAVIDLDGGTVPSPPSPNPPVQPGSLAQWVADAVDQVPDHKLKQEASAGLSAAYSGLAKKYRDGEVSDLAALLAARKELHARLTAALGVTTEWSAFDKALVAELNRRDPTGSNAAANLEQVAAGLSLRGANAAIDPAILQAGVELVVALLSKDSAAISAAIGKLVVALLGSIGG